VIITTTIRPQCAQTRPYFPQREKDMMIIMCTNKINTHRKNITRILVHDNLEKTLNRGFFYTFVPEKVCKEKHLKITQQF